MHFDDTEEVPFIKGVFYSWKLVIVVAMLAGVVVSAISDIFFGAQWTLPMAIKWTGGSALVALWVSAAYTMAQPVYGNWFQLGRPKSGKNPNNPL